MLSLVDLKADVKKIDLFRPELSVLPVQGVFVVDVVVVEGLVDVVVVV